MFSTFKNLSVSAQSAQLTSTTVCIKPQYATCCLGLAVAAVSVVDDLSSMQAQHIVEFANADVEFAEGTQFVFVVARANADGKFELLQVVVTSRHNQG